MIPLESTESRLGIFRVDIGFLPIAASQLLPQDHRM